MSIPFSVGSRQPRFCEHRGDEIHIDTVVPYTYASGWYGIVMAPRSVTMNGRSEGNFMFSILRSAMSRRCRGVAIEGVLTCSPIPSTSATVQPRPGAIPVNPQHRFQRSLVEDRVPVGFGSRQPLPRRPRGGMGITSTSFWPLVGIYR